MFICKLSGDRWVNLRHLRAIQIENNPDLVVITWASGDNSVYRGRDATVLIEVFLNLNSRYKVEPPVLRHEDY